MLILDMYKTDYSVNVQARTAKKNRDVHNLFMTCNNASRYIPII